MNKIFYIASRYLFFRNKKQAINVLSFITMFAMACGAGALLVILSTFNGFESLSKNLNESFQPDLTVIPLKSKQFDIDEDKLIRIRHLENVEMVSKIMEEKVYIKYQENGALATLKGVDSNYFKTNQVKDYIIAGDSVLENDEYSFAILGVGISQRLNVNLDNQFEQISVYYPKSEASGLGLKDNFELSYITAGGVFSIYQDYDEKYMLVPLSFIQYLNNSDENRISSLEIKLKNPKDLNAQSAIKDIMGEKFDVKNKLELNASFYRISQIEKLVVFFILTFVLIILSFNFIGSLTMHIIEKEKDIKILNYIGLKANDIFKLYLTYGVLQGMLGGVIGILFGLGICLFQYYFGFVKMPGSGTFVITDYPVQIEPSDILLILIVLFFVSLFASILPALKAKKAVEQ